VGASSENAETAPEREMQRIKTIINEINLILFLIIISSVLSSF
jgi:hypothetical protein